MPPARPRKPDISATNKERNEYIPSFIAKKPFYVPDDAAESSGDYLEHQRIQQQKEQDSKWYDRGKKVGPAATKFRKGACENCGAMTHKTKECLSRPRKQGARWTGRNIQADESIEDVNLGWDAKRDRWNGYDAAEYDKVVEEYKELELRKKWLRGAEGGNEDDAEGENDDAKYEEETDMGRQQPTSTRNLRLREDTAKYLLNLDLDSAKYDPKTRSMVDSGATKGNESALVAEEGFMRASGDAAEFESAQRYAWEMQQRGDKNKLHLQANPTSGEVMRRIQLKEAEVKREAHRKALTDKYGEQEQHRINPLKDIAVEESEWYVEYDESGGIKGAIKIKAKSKYPEDIFMNNHTSVWGSWWANFQWGYACCHSTVKNSYCTGDQGKAAFEEANRLRTGAVIEEDQLSRTVAQREEETSESRASNSVKEDANAKSDIVVRKRAFDETKDRVSDEQMEEYRRKRTTTNDPMATMLGKDELV